MITWMQRHKKYLIITIWISTIAFVGAGFVGWGQYSYGDKAGAVAKVGSIEITMGELQKGYSRLYSQYNKMFQGNFDEEKAKSFGLQGQALKQLTDQALILNLAAAYDLEISDAELLKELMTQEFFFKDGSFDKEIYKQVISRNNLTINEYEKDLKKQLLIQKTLALLPVKTNSNEFKIVDTLMSISDKINYKILDDSKINIELSDETLKPFWETKKQNFMTEVSYDIKYIKQEKANEMFEDSKIASYYADNKTHFKSEDGKILPLESAKEQVIAALNKKATKNKALRTYIAYKKGKLDSNVHVISANISASNNPFNHVTLEKISKLLPTAPYMKPVEVNGEYFTIELVKTVPATTKSYEDAKEALLPIYMTQTKKTKLVELAESSVKTFTGKETDFLTLQDASKLTDLSLSEANEFLNQLFSKEKKRSLIALSSGKIVLYNILEQKLLTNTNNKNNDLIVKIKSAMFNEGLIKNLQNKYNTEIFIEGL